MTDQKSNEENFTDFPIRDQLVNTAVNFLLNSDVQKRSNDSKIAFLKKKGLTDNEISAAFDHIKLNSQGGVDTVPLPDREKFQYPIPNTPLYQPYSFWSRVSGISSSLIIFGVAIYGLHHFYKVYIKPWLLGEETESETLRKSLEDLNKNLTMLVETVDKFNKLIVKQNEDINKLIQIEGYAPTPVILEEVKRDVNSLKSILISRHQFPAAPQLQRATIPAWQLSTATDSESENKPVDLVANKTLPGTTSYQISDNKVEDSTVNTCSEQQSCEILENSHEVNNTVLNASTEPIKLDKTEAKDLVDSNCTFETNKETAEESTFNDTEEALNVNGVLKSIELNKIETKSLVDSNYNIKTNKETTEESASNDT